MSILKGHALKKMTKMNSGGRVASTNMVQLALQKNLTKYYKKAKHVI